VREDSFEKQTNKKHSHEIISSKDNNNKKQQHEPLKKEMIVTVKYHCNHMPSPPPSSINHLHGNHS